MTSLHEEAHADSEECIGCAKRAYRQDVERMANHVHNQVMIWFEEHPLEKPEDWYPSLTMTRRK